MSDLRTAALMLGGQVSGGSILCPGPQHSSRDRSLSVTFSASAPDGFLVWSHAGDDQLAAKDYVRERLGLSRVSKARSADHEAPKSGDRKIALKEIDDLPARTARALSIWEEARTPIASPVERYMDSRGLTLPNDPRDVLRFHPSCPFAGTRTRAMVALVRDVVTNEPVAIHRTALDLAGHKVEVNGKDRLALGPIGRGAVKLTADENVTLALGIGEGIESTLSLQGIPEFGDTPVWSLLNAGGVAGFPVLSGVETLWIGVDHDPAGIAAGDICARRWRAAGSEVFLVTPTRLKADLNDIVKEAAHG